MPRYTRCPLEQSAPRCVKKALAALISRAAEVEPGSDKGRDEIEHSDFCP